MENPVRRLRVDPKDPKPLWSQIEEGMRHLVASGGLEAGGAVPSVRDLARDLKINPATVSKAYQRLTDAGVFEVRRGDGTYVALEAPALTRGEKTRLMKESARRYVAVAITLGASRDEAVAAVASTWSENLREKGAER